MYTCLQFSVTSSSFDWRLHLWSHVFQHSSSVPVTIVRQPSFLCPRCLLWTPQPYLSLDKGDLGFVLCVCCASVEKKYYLIVHHCQALQENTKGESRQCPLIYLGVWCRSLTLEEIAQRRELSRSRHAEMMAAGRLAGGDNTKDPNLPVTQQEVQAAGNSEGKYTFAY